MRRYIFALALIFLATSLTASAQSPDPAGSSSQSDPAPAPCTANCPQTPAKPAAPNLDAPAKPPAKPHKVITNDDMDARPHDITMSGTRDILQQLNTCDRTCFDQVAQRAGVYTYNNSRWKLSLLDAIEVVKADAVWQGILGEIIGIQGLACETQAKKTEDIRRFADPPDVQPGQQGDHDQPPDHVSGRVRQSRPERPQVVRDEEG